MSTLGGNKYLWRAPDGTWYIRRKKWQGKSLRQSLKTKCVAEARRIRDRDWIPLFDSDDQTLIMSRFRKRLEVTTIRIHQAWSMWVDHPRIDHPGAAWMGKMSIHWRDLTSWVDCHYPGTETLDQLADVVHGDGLKVSLAELYADHLRRRVEANEISPKTRNQRLGVCKKICRDLRVEPNPFATVRKTSLGRNSRRRLPFDIEQLPLILAEAGNPAHLSRGQSHSFAPWLRRLASIGSYTGQSLGDCCLLEWRNVHLSTDTIVFDRRKLRHKDLEPARCRVLPQLRELLIECRDATESGQYVLPPVAKQYQTYPNFYGRWFRRVLEAVGLKPHQVTDGAQKPIVQYSFHSFRYTFVSLAHRAGWPLQLIAESVGHHVLEQTVHYTRLSDKDVAAMAQQMPAAPQELTLEDVVAHILRLDADNVDQVKADILAQLKVTGG